MKNTLITLISVAALTGAANAQVTIGGTTYNIGDGLVFNTVADAIAGNVDHVNARIPGSRYDRTYGVGQPNYYYDSLLHSVRSAGTTTNLTWGTAGVTQIDDSWIQSDGVIEMVLGTVETIGSTTYDVGDGLVFNTVADAIAGNVDHVNARIPGSRYDRTYGVGQPNYYYDSLLHSVRSAGTTTSLTWGTAGVTQIDDSWIQSDGVVEMIVGQQVPEPSSSALLGLGALGLLTRRKRS